jgi:O-antigen/teichoic acid export membrane protein
MDISEATSKVFIARGAGFILSFLAITIFSNMLGARQIGVFFLFQALLNIGSFAADFGIRDAVEKRISEGNEPEQVLATGLIIKILPLSLILLAILIGRSIINEYVGLEVSILLAVGIVLHEFARLTIKILNGELRVQSTAVILASRHFVWFVVGITLVFQGFDIKGVIYGYLLGYTVMIGWGTVRISTSVGTPSVTQAKSLIKYAKFDAISGGGWRLYSWIDVVIIGFFLSQAAVGAYEIAWKVAEITMLFGAAVRTSIFPQISRWYEDGDLVSIENLLSRVVTPTLFLVIPAFFCTVILSREIMTFIFGPEFGVAWLVLIVFMIQKILQALNQVYGRTLQAIDQPDLAAYAMVVGVVVNLTLNIVFVINFGIIGAAIATAVSFGVMTGLRIRYLSRFMKIRFPYSDIGWCFAASLGMACALFVVKYTLTLDGIPEIIGAVIFGAIIYTLLWLAHPRLRQDTFRLFSEYLSG